MALKSHRISDSYNSRQFKKRAGKVLSIVSNASSLDEARGILSRYVSTEQFKANQSLTTVNGSTLHIVRDCGRALRGMLNRRADKLSGFSVAQALWDLARDKERPDLTPGFFAEMTHIILGLNGRVPSQFSFYNKESVPKDESLSGRKAAKRRSDNLDALWSVVEKTMNRYSDGLSEEARERRDARRATITQTFGVSDAEFSDWKWQVKNVIKDAQSVAKLIPLSKTEIEAINRARTQRLPFGVTPYYASLMDPDPTSGRDRSIRAQVLPPIDYVEQMLAHREDRSYAFDFMLERDTSPVNLITRRYPAIVILKPFNTCPQICVYCQRNWEIEEAMADDALASDKAIAKAIAFIRERPAIKEVLVTGGDPLGLTDGKLLSILKQVAEIPHVDFIRIGSRTPVTMPMRITPRLAKALGDLREFGRREVALVTHVEHPYEITPDMVLAVDRLRRNGIAVYNQNVYTFFVSRRFEASKLRMVLRRIGIDPYYTFTPKGKTETNAYRVPLARILQEQKEEARLLPGTRRTDEPVYNVPGLGKNHLRAFQHRDLISILPTGERVYDFHPWEKGIAPCDNYVGSDVSILDYLQRLQDIGEDPDDYASIWYYF